MAISLQQTYRLYANYRPPHDGIDPSLLPSKIEDNIPAHSPSLLVPLHLHLTFIHRLFTATFRLPSRQDSTNSGLGRCGEETESRTTRTRYEVKLVTRPRQRALKQHNESVATRRPAASTRCYSSANSYWPALHETTLQSPRQAFWQGEMVPHRFVQHVIDGMLHKASLSGHTGTLLPS